jgi:hypothetical protein
VIASEGDGLDQIIQVRKLPNSSTPFSLTYEGKACSKMEYGRDFTRVIGDDTYRLLDINQRL